MIDTLKSYRYKMHDKEVLSINSKMNRDGHNGDIDCVFVVPNLNGELRFFTNTNNSHDKEFYNYIDQDLSIEMQIKTIEMLALIKGTSPQEAFIMERDSLNTFDEDEEDYFLDENDSIFEPVDDNIDSDDELTVESISNNGELEEDIFVMEL